MLLLGNGHPDHLLTLNLRSGRTRRIPIPLRLSGIWSRGGTDGSSWNPRTDTVAFSIGGQFQMLLRLRSGRFSVPVLASNAVGVCFAAGRAMFSREPLRGSAVRV